MANKRTYQFGKSQLTLEFSSITTSKAQVLVSSDDYYLSMGGGVSASILNAGGNVIALDAAKKVPAALGDVVVTTAGKLPAQYIFHAVTIGPDDSVMLPKETIRQTTKRCMQMLDTLQLDSIAFPTIGAGIAGFTYEDVAVQMAEVITEDLQKRQKPVYVTIYLFDRLGRKKEIDYLQFFEEFAARVPRIANQAVAAHTPMDPVKQPTAIDDGSETDDQIRMRRLNNLRKLIGSLEDKRFELEARLIELINSGEEEDITELRRKLDENQELRLGYLNELKSLSQKDSSYSTQAQASIKRPVSVFVSSSYKDLIGHRTAVKDQIMRRDMLFRGMETFGADPSRVTPAIKIVDEVRKANVYIGIFGVRYGYIDQATGLSMTELEFNEAETSGKPMFLYVIRDDAPVKVSDIEPDPAGKAKLDSLKSRMRKDYVVYM
ncbi:MAG TPA: macro domain-containing protein, partial [Blastocatellia bacterium]|nr:macro domain-containing protein [Blastocatellia bacterium]